MGVDLKYYNIELIDITDILADTVLPDWIDYMHEFSVDPTKKAHKLKIFYHFFIKTVCDLLLDADISTKKVLFLNLRQERIPNTILRNRAAAAGYNDSEFYLLVKGLITKLERNFPLKFYISSYSYDKFLKLIDSGDGHAVYHINLMRIKLDTIGKNKYQYNLVNKFIKKYELTWLDENYFNSFKTKLLSIL